MVVAEVNPETILKVRGGGAGCGLNQNQYTIKGMTHWMGLNLISNINTFIPLVCDVSIS